MSDETAEDDDFEGNDIAIIGMACRFPNAKNPAEFWTNLRDGKESITQLSDEQLRETGVSDAEIQNSDYVKSGMFLEDVAMFDASFFGLSPRDGRIMDPQHRQFLECSWEALEDAGYDPAKFDGAVGVYAGSGHNLYMPLNLFTNPELVDEIGYFLVRHTGNDKDFLATRVSYSFDLKGPSVNLQTACSTSLVCTHMAAQSLLNGECDMALAGGVTIDMPLNRGYLYRENEILSPDGHCRPFEADSKGTVFGSGVGVILLRRLTDAEVDGDNILAVIKSSAINNDGSSKVSYLAPSVDGQVGVINEALEIGEIDPQSVTYIECHGTGTELGDPIEVAAMTQAYGANHDHKQYCGIGSVKSNIGHLDTAAGVAGLIKVVQSLRHKQIPPTLHYKKPNPAIDFASSPFYVNAQLRNWISEGPRRAAISSLGVGGTNAHIILEEAPERPLSGESRPWQLMTYSARGDKPLQDAVGRIAAHATQNNSVPLADIAYTLAVGRRDFSKRKIAVVQSHGDLAQLVELPKTDRWFSANAPEAEQKIVFMFAGGGAQYPNMGKDLYQSEPVYRKTVDECLNILDRLIDFDLRALLFPEPENEEQAAAELIRPSRSLAALFTTQIAQARLWLSWGIKPEVMIGHSMGEYTAACVSGIFSLGDALAVVVKRSQLFDKVEPGGMLSVMLSPEKVNEYLGSELSLAVINGAELCVIAGPDSALSALQERLESEDLQAQRIHIDIAAHSLMLEPILPEFKAFLETINYQKPKIPVASNHSGMWLSNEEATDPNYWVRHLRETVRFSDGLALVLEEQAEAVLLEVGPGNIMSSLARQHHLVSKANGIFHSMRHPKEEINDQAMMLTALGKLWASGVPIDWKYFYEAEDRQRASLPTYAFDHQKYWVDPGEAVTTGSSAYKQNVDRWYYQTTWQAKANFSLAKEDERRISDVPVILFAESEAFSDCVVQQISNLGGNIILINPGRNYSQPDDQHFTIDPDNGEHYMQLFEDLAKRFDKEIAIVHSWALTAPKSDAALPMTLYSLMFIAQALAEQQWPNCAVMLVTKGTQQLSPAEVVDSPVAATMLGASRVLSKEIAGVVSRYVDIDWLGDQQLNSTVNSMLAELFSESNRKICEQNQCYRAGMRFEESFTQLELRAEKKLTIVADASYLITGGLGGLGLALAEYLVDQGVKQLVLWSRSSLPERSEWQRLRDSDRQNRATQRVKAVLALEAKGATVLVNNVDICDANQVAVGLAAIKAEFSTVKGIFHTAGTIDDNLIQIKTKSEVAAVLQPKVQGTMVIDKAFSNEDLDFMILYSSVSSLIGMQGQFDYAAANAFLDSFARHRRQRDGLAVTSVNWSAWQEVGMAVEMASGNRVGPGFATFTPKLVGNGFQICLSNDDWIINEHRTKDGLALVPGTGLVAFAHAAMSAKLVGTAGIIEINDVFFLAPFAVEKGQQLMANVNLKQQNDTLQFTIYSAASPDAIKTEDWLSEHVQGTVRALSIPQPEQQSIEQIKARCNVWIDQKDGKVEHAHMDFGERWQNVQAIYFGHEEALVELSLAVELEGDLRDNPLHPALLDMATGVGQPLVPDYRVERDFFVPQSYGSVKVFAALQREMVSHLVLKPSESKEFCNFDITVLSLEGNVLIQISDFTMKRMSHDSLDTTAQQVQNQPQGGNALGEDIMMGINPSEGKQTIAAMMAHLELPQVIISPRDFAWVIDKNRVAIGTGSEEKAEETQLDRPDISSDYVAPESEFEKVVIDMWQKALGISQIGIADNFFELGGHSLLLTQIATKAKKQLKIDLPIAKLFEDATVMAWSKLVASTCSEQGGPKKNKLKRVSRDAHRVKR